MMNNKKYKDIATLYYRNKHLLLLTIVILLLAGMVAINNLPRLEDPRITTRNASILTFLPGASAKNIETLINEKIENTLKEINEIKNISSTARANVSSIKIELEDYVTNKDNEQIFSKIRSRLQNVQGELPPSASIPFLDDRRGATAYTLILAIKWNGKDNPPLNILQRIALDLKDQMLRVKNTELIRIFGGVNEEITVTPDISKLAALNMTSSQLVAMISKSDSKISAGQLRAENNDIQIEVNGALDSLEQISDIPITTKDKKTVIRLGDIADIERGYQQPELQIGIKDGERVIYVAVRADKNVRVDLWTESALKTYQEFKNYYSKFVDVDIIFEQNKYTAKLLNNLLSNLIMGAIVVIAILICTMGWKSALVAGSVLPLACAGAIFSFNFFGQSIHQMSIFGMIIAIGLLIDSAIVVTDEVQKCINQKNMKPIDAVRYSVHHLFSPLLASTLTTILGFMPIFLMPGNAGDFVGPIAVSVVLALVFSFILAITVIPSLSALTSSVPAKNEKFLSWWQVGIKKPNVFDDIKNFTLHAMTQPKRYLFLAIIPSLIGFSLIKTMDVEFFPPADRDMLEVQIYLPNDSSIDYTSKKVDIADKIVKKIKGIKQIHWLIGSSTPAVYYNQVPTQDNNSAYAQAVITADTSNIVSYLIPQLQNDLSYSLPDARVIVKKFAQGPPSDAPVAFRILGEDINILRNLGEQVRAIMHEDKNILQTRANIEGGQKKLWFNADRIKSYFAGLYLVDIANQFQGNLEGFTGGSILESSQELPVRVRLNNNERSNIISVGNIQLSVNNAMNFLPAETVGELQLLPEVAQINRYNNKRVNNILAYLKDGAKAVTVSTDLIKQINSQVNAPSGYIIEVAGESEQQSKAMGSLAAYAPLLIIIIIAIIILTFRSVSLAIIVLAVAILAVGLGMLSLKISGYPLGFNPLLGTIGLAGVVINNTIIILAAILKNKKAILGDSVEIIKETYSCGRHILSTTATTIGGFIPLLLFSGGTFWPPLTVVIAGGMGFGIILGMFFTPLAYKIYANIYFSN